MQYAYLVETYERLEATTKRLEMTEILAELLKNAEPEVVEKVIYLTQGKIHPDWTGEPEIGMAERMVNESIIKASGLKKKEVETLTAETGDIGITAQIALKKKRVGKFGGRKLSVNDVYSSLDKIAKESGKGSSTRKIDRLVNLMVNTSPLGARYLTRTVVGTLRLGVGDMTILDALSLAFTDSANNRDILERAYNLTSDLGYVAKTIAEAGIKALENVKVTLGKPIMMMLAQRLSTAEETIEKLGRCSAEYKLDGERFQIHKNGEKIQIFSRRRENITHMYPDAVNMTQRFICADKAIVEGEAVAIDPDTGEMKPFQTLMQRRRKYNIEEMMEKFPIAIFLFECLYVNGEDMTLMPYTMRRRHLIDIVKEDERFKPVRAFETSDPDELDKFFNEATTDGTEGLVVKSTSKESIYRAGARSWLWVKLKRSYQSKMVEPVDLTVVGAFHGRGRRAGSYGALLLAAYDSKEDVYSTVCKVGSGFTDENLIELPELLIEYQCDEKHTRVNSLIDAELWFKPSLVLEVLGDEITLSPVHTCAFNRLKKNSGLAIRFPRFIRFREDKAPEDSTKVEEIEEMYRAQLKKI
jgi:DNA ligase-1